MIKKKIGQLIQETAQPLCTLDKECGTTDPSFHSTRLSLDVCWDSVRYLCEVCTCNKQNDPESSQSDKRNELLLRLGVHPN